MNPEIFVSHENFTVDLTVNKKELNLDFVVSYDSVTFEIIGHTVRTIHMYEGDFLDVSQKDLIDIAVELEIYIYDHVAHEIIANANETSSMLEELAEDNCVSIALGK